MDIDRRIKVFVGMNNAIDKTANVAEYAFFCNQDMKDIYLFDFEIYKDIPICVDRNCPDGIIYLVKKVLPMNFERDNYGYV